MNIKELAKRAGVSSATVSRVLNNSGYVKEETRKKVLEAVEEYHYVPNAIARNLSINDNPSIGVIIPDIENEFFFKAISGISEIADSYHYNIVYFGTNETLDKEHEFLNAAISQRLKGVIIAGLPAGYGYKGQSAQAGRIRHTGCPYRPRYPGSTL